MSAMPPIDDPAHDELAVELGKTILWERALLPPVVLGQCELIDHGARCARNGLLVRVPGLLEPILGGADVFLCPKHGADITRAVRRWPR